VEGGGTLSAVSVLAEAASVRKRSSSGGDRGVGVWGEVRRNRADATSLMAEEERAKGLAGRRVREEEECSSALGQRVGGERSGK